ncbi:hypothetical protein [Alicyclobacillus ferrooxydans]|uniref:Uncharacterized protein n=1 Tax=Alicyclobacillus ferrooxydans TaxID=471514 RepID=A0A0P9CZU9_9BACL|nr:hypothetical protein [Alicyclobacillus ferrooxydans]KPV45263.1 hypothetical protein AN477_02375 [Alicyclobacillus ferrooxydans]
MQVVPSAVGQSDGVIVFWDDNPEIGVAWPRPVQVVDSIEWGIGSVNEEECLVLYMFVDGQSLELYMLPELPTNATQVLDVVKLVCDWDPNMVKVRYGESPGDKTHEVLFLLPKSEDAGVVAKLRELHMRTLHQGDKGSRRDTAGHIGDGPAVTAESSLMLRLDSYLKESIRDVEE